MTFNVEPAMYVKGYGGIRHCDVMTVRADGPEVLTPLPGGARGPRDPAWLIRAIQHG
jgi:Xaa-Pro aminopeptidase